MKQVVPQYTIITCDFCKKRIMDTSGRKQAELKFYRNGLDMMNTPQCALKDDFDLCDYCCEALEDYINTQQNS